MPPTPTPTPPCLQDAHDNVTVVREGGTSESFTRSKVAEVEEADIEAEAAAEAEARRGTEGVGDGSGSSSVAQIGEIRREQMRMRATQQRLSEQMEQVLQLLQQRLPPPPAGAKLGAFEA